MISSTVLLNANTCLPFPHKQEAWHKVETIMQFKEKQHGSLIIRSNHHEPKAKQT